MTEWPFVRSWVHRQSVGSTNDLARELVADPQLELPLLVTADEQTGGRGRGENRWWSDEGSLTATVAIDGRDVGLLLADEPKIALVAAVSVVDALATILPGCPFQIRWPNDVEVSGRKLAGLLPERVQSERGGRVLVGIGLNLGTRLECAPAEVRCMAVSLAELAAPGALVVDRTEMLRLILGFLEAGIERLKSRGLELAHRWNELDALAGKPVRIAQGPNVIEGVARGVDESGSLRLEREDRIVLIRGGQVLRDG
jgi:BirA family biotin operon repressor/biotin-[acetyl-CoA-carboxylase] ligase